MPDEAKIIALLEDAVAEAQTNGIDAGFCYVALAQEEWESDQPSTTKGTEQ